MDCLPVIRRFVLSKPNSNFITLNEGEPMPDFMEKVRDLDYIFVINGMIEVKCDRLLSHTAHKDGDTGIVE